jgi:Coenzyme PQQ synthesis protein D (PqqD)
MDSNSVSLRPSQASTVQCQPMPDGSALLYETETATCFSITETARLIWDFCDGDRDVGQIVAMVVNQYDVEPQKAQADVISFIQDLRQKGLISS